MNSEKEPMTEDEFSDLLMNVLYRAHQSGWSAKGVWPVKKVAEFAGKCVNDWQEENYEGDD